MNADFRDVGPPGGAATGQLNAQSLAMREIVGKLREPVRGDSGLCYRGRARRTK